MTTLGEANVRTAALKGIDGDSVDALINMLQRAQIGDR